jgi:hypothetical protein
MQIFGSFSYGAPTLDLDRNRAVAVESQERQGSPQFAYWQPYTANGFRLTTEMLFRHSQPFLDWEMGLNSPFAGTYASPVGFSTL